MSFFCVSSFLMELLPVELHSIVLFHAYHMLFWGVIFLYVFLSFMARIF